MDTIETDDALEHTSTKRTKDSSEELWVCDLCYLITCLYTVQINKQLLEDKKTIALHSELIPWPGNSGRTSIASVIIVNLLDIIMSWSMAFVIHI